MTSQMLIQDPETTIKLSNESSRPSCYKTTIDSPQSGTPEAASQRELLIFQPRWTPTPEETTLTSESDISEEISEIAQDAKESFGVRELNGAEAHSTDLVILFQSRLIEKLISSTMQPKGANSQLVADFFTRAASKELRSPAACEEGFRFIIDMLDDVIIDAPKAIDVLSKMMRLGPA